MTTPTLPAEGTIITTPRGFFIDFRNIHGRSLSAADVQSLTDGFIKVANETGADAAITSDSLVALPVPGDRRSVKLVAGNLDYYKDGKPGILRLAFTESAKGSKAPLSGTLLLDLRDREAKSAAVTVHAPNTDAAQPAYALYEQLETLQRKGLLNNINMKLTTRDNTLSMSMSSRASKSFTLRF